MWGEKQLKLSTLNLILNHVFHMIDLYFNFFPFLTSYLLFFLFCFLEKAKKKKKIIEICNSKSNTRLFVQKIVWINGDNSLLDTKHYKINRFRLRLIMFMLYSCQPT